MGGVFRPNIVPCQLFHKGGGGSIPMDHSIPFRNRAGVIPQRFTVQCR